MSNRKPPKWTTRGTTAAAPAGYDEKEADAARRQVGAGRPGDESYVALPAGTPLPPDLGPGWTKVATVTPPGASKPYDVYARPDGKGKPTDKPRPVPPGAKPGPDRPDGDPKGSPDGTKPKSQAPPGEAPLKAIDKDFSRQDVGCTAGECGTEFAKGVIEGGVIAFLMTALVAVFAPKLLLLFLVVGLVGMAAEVIDLARDWNNLTDAEKSRRLGRLAGGLVGGAKGAKAGGPRGKPGGPAGEAPGGKGPPARPAEPVRPPEPAGKPNSRYNNEPNFGKETETYDPRPVRPQNATREMENFLGPGPHSNVNPRTGKVEPDRLWSADGKRSIRYGEHEMNSSPTKHHYHEETWTTDPNTGKVNVHNNVRRVPNQRPPQRRPPPPRGN